MYPAVCLPFSIPSTGYCVTVSTPGLHRVCTLDTRGKGAKGRKSDNLADYIPPELTNRAGDEAGGLVPRINCLPRLPKLPALRRAVVQQDFCTGNERLLLLNYKAKNRTFVHGENPLGPRNP